MDRLKNIRIVELFAGVGGFRLGLESASSKDCQYTTVWANQWEPTTAKQHAADIYVNRFGSNGFSNQDIQQIVANNLSSIPDHDLLVGGFPCQDYSVARPLNGAQGLVGKKGVLFWAIYAILKGKGEKAPRYILLENVDRLLKSPVKQRGRDFAVMLAVLSDLGYAIEWRVIDAADYGFPQRRKRVFIMGYKQNTKLYPAISSTTDCAQWLTTGGVLANAFPIQKEVSEYEELQINGMTPSISKNFSVHQPNLSPFKNSGIIVNRNVVTASLRPLYSGKRLVLRDIILNEKDVPEEFFIAKSKLKKWKYLKGAKREERQSSSGHAYHYSEGSMLFPDSLDKPARTIITGEGGMGASRFKHVILTPSGRYRRLTPLELERINMFPDEHTKLEGISDSRRAFIMGNALVVGVVQRIGESLAQQIRHE